MLRFTKMNGAGNDFVMIDNRAGDLQLAAEQIARFAIGIEGSAPMGSWCWSARRMARIFGCAITTLMAAKRRCAAMERAVLLATRITWRARSRSFRLKLRRA